MFYLRWSKYHHDCGGEDLCALSLTSQYLAIAITQCGWCSEDSFIGIFVCSVKVLIDMVKH